MLVSVDPGVRCAGVAMFHQNGRLVEGWLVEGDGWRNTAELLADSVNTRIPFNTLRSRGHLAIEVPQVYTQNKLKGDPNDLILVSLMVGCVVGRLSHVGGVTEYRPREWKGQTPKNVMINRIKGKLDSLEQRLVKSSKKSLEHNVWDAVGVGLHHLQKQKRKE